MEFDPARDYPLGARRSELVLTPSGLHQHEITLDALRSHSLVADDLRATPATIRRQAAVARAACRPQLAENLERAAELATVPAETVLEIYTALRPMRSTAQELEAWALYLESNVGAPRTAEFVREARDAYESRGLLAGDEQSPAQI